MLYCEKCNNKIFTDGTNLQSLVKVPSAPIQIRGKETLKQPLKLKCPKCGFLFRTIKLEQPKPKEEEGKTAE